VTAIKKYACTLIGILIGTRSSGHICPDTKKLKIGRVPIHFQGPAAELESLSLHAMSNDSTSMLLVSKTVNVLAVL
jgi:hypothetical protein